MSISVFHGGKNNFRMLTTGCTKKSTLHTKKSFMDNLLIKYILLKCICTWVVKKITNYNLRLHLLTYVHKFILFLFAISYFFLNSRK